MKYFNQPAKLHTRWNPRLMAHLSSILVLNQHSGRLIRQTYYNFSSRELKLLSSLSLSLPLSLYNIFCPDIASAPKKVEIITGAAHTFTCDTFGTDQTVTWTNPDSTTNSGIVTVSDITNGIKRSVRI